MSTRWEISKRFYKYSEKLLSLPAEKEEDLIQILLRALKEVFQAEECYYFKGNRTFYLAKGRIQSQIADYPKEQFHCITLAGEEGSPTPHLLFARLDLLKGNKAKYFDLVIPQYQLCLQKFLVQNAEPPEDAEPQSAAKPVDGSIRAKYRRQKEVILALENFARKQNPKSMILKDLEELPDLEEEIIHFQNQLIKDLALSRKQSFDARQEQERMGRFYQIFMDEMADRLSIAMGLVQLIEHSAIKKGSFQPQSLVTQQLTSLKSFCEAMVSAIESEHQRGVLKVEKIILLDLLHESLKEASEIQEGHNMTISFDPSLEGLEMQGDPLLLRQAMSHFFQFMVKLQWGSGSEEQLAFHIQSQEREEGPILRILTDGIAINDEVEAQLQRPKSLYHCLNFGFVAPSMLHYFLSLSLARHQGTVQFLAKEQGEERTGQVDAIIQIGSLQAVQVKGKDPVTA